MNVRKKEGEKENDCCFCFVLQWFSNCTRVRERDSKKGNKRELGTSEKKQRKKVDVKEAIRKVRMKKSDKGK